MGRRKKILRSSRLIGLIAIVVSTLVVGLIVIPVCASTMPFGENQMTFDSSSQQNPDIYSSGWNDYVIVWQDNRNGNWDIYMYNQAYYGDDNWSVNYDFRVTANSANNENPKVYGDAIVYQSDRTGNWDIYMYNITSKVETQITSNPAIQSNPAINGNTIVWQDARNAVWQKFAYDYVGWDIYMYNLTTHTEQRLPLSPNSNLSPAISGDRIVYSKEIYSASDFSSYWPYVYTYDLSTGIETQVAAGSITQAYSPTSKLISPGIDGNIVVWAQYFIAVRGQFPTYVDKYDWNVYARDLSTGASWGSASGYQMSPDVSGYWIVYQDNSNGNWDLYVHDFTNNVNYPVANNTANQVSPAIETHNIFSIVYTDYRNGNSDIYMSTALYGGPKVGAGAPTMTGPTPTPITVGNTSNSSNQAITTIIISATVAVVIVVIGGATIMAMKERHSKKPNKESPSK